MLFYSALQMQELGLATEYQATTSTKVLLRQLLSLPLLPKEHIRAAFTLLEEQVASPLQRRLFMYVENTWINGDTWTPARWSVFGQPVRTNND